MLILTSCEHKDYFAFDDVSFVRNFPNKYVLGKADTLDVELIGIHGVKSFGDYLLVSCAAPKGCLSTVTLGKETKVTNTFLMIGSGPGEVLYRPYIVSIRRNAYCSGERSSLLLQKIEIL